MIKKTKEFKQLSENWIILLYIPLFFLLYLVLRYFGLMGADINAQNMLNRDAVWYESIVRNDYVFVENDQANTAFFPLFSYVWKLLQVNALQIAGINSIFMGLAVFLLKEHFQIKGMEFWVLLSTPMLVFCFVPYSEALYFLTSTILLIGLSKKNLLWIFIGVVLVGFVRSIMVFFIPASCIMLVYYWREAIEYRKIVCTIITASLFSFVLVMSFQYSQTQVWFTFFKAQKYWDHYLQMPKLPFFSWRRETLWEDLIAMAIAFVLSFLLLRYMYYRLFKTNKVSLLEPVFLFSILNLLAVAAFIFLFQGGDFHSLNRYFFCTPFFWIVALAMKQEEWQVPSWIWWFATAIFFLLSSNGILANNFEIDKFLIYPLVMALLLARFLFWTGKIKSKAFCIGLSVIGFAMQLHLFHLYLSGNGIG